MHLLYDPALRTASNIKKLNKSHLKNTILETLSFLSNKTIQEHNKNRLIDMLCLKIKNFFPDVCQLCNEHCSVKIGDKNFLSCASCGQEVDHKCYLQLFKKMNLLDEKKT